VPISVEVRWRQFGWNVAVTDLFAFITGLQLPVPEQAPDHPVKWYPGLVLGVRATVVP